MPINRTTSIGAQSNFFVTGVVRAELTENDDILIELCNSRGETLSIVVEVESLLAVCLTFAESLDHCVKKTRN